MGNGVGGLGENGDGGGRRFGAINCYFLDFLYLS